MNATPLAFFQNFGFWEMVFLVSLLYVFFSRMGARKLGNSVGRAIGSDAPESATPSSGSTPSAPPSSLAECYRVLEVPESASSEQIREAYKNLVKVWHPDRFQNDPKLREKAELKLKEINTAYDRLNSQK